jgi:hypothetical protein
LQVMTSTTRRTQSDMLVCVHNTEATGISKDF